MHCRCTFNACMCSRASEIRTIVVPRRHDWSCMMHCMPALVVLHHTIRVFSSALRHSVCVCKHVYMECATVPIISLLRSLHVPVSGSLCSLRPKSFRTVSRAYKLLPARVGVSSLPIGMAWHHLLQKKKKREDLQGRMRAHRERQRRDSST